MTADTKKRGLGRGLDALFKDVKSEEGRYKPAVAEEAPVTPQAPAREVEQVEPKIMRAEEMELAAKHDLNAMGSLPVEIKSVETVADKQPTVGTAVLRVPIEKLSPGKYQPRKNFDEEALSGLADSIIAFGILQPLIVRPLGGGHYEIVAGERRWRAAQLAQLHEVPVLMREMSDQEALEIALLENLQREDLNPMEEAEGYQRLMDDFMYTQDQMSYQIGKSRSHISNTLRLLKLPKPVRGAVRDGRLSAGHARAIVASSNPLDIAEEVLARGLNVRQTEKLIRAQAGGRIKPVDTRTKPDFVEKDVDTRALERQIEDILGLKIEIIGQGAAGKLVVHYKSLDQLDDVVARLTRRG